MRRWILLLAALPLWAQSAAFEVASVKKQPWTGTGSVGVFVRGNTLDAEHCTLNDLVEYAYNVRFDHISGAPTWGDRSGGKLVDSELYQVMGKVAGETPPPVETFRQMLQSLLAERFQLQVHHLEKDFPVYQLVVDRGGPKMKSVAAGVKFKNVQSPVGRDGIRMVTTQLTMEKFAAMIGGYAGRPVFDKTGLAGGFEFTLEFMPENRIPDPNASMDAPALSSALRNQLGLRLEASTAPFDTIIIDRAERPSGN